MSWSGLPARSLSSYHDKVFCCDDRGGYEWDRFGSGLDGWYCCIHGAFCFYYDFSFVAWIFNRLFRDRIGHKYTNIENELDIFSPRT